MVEHCVGVSCSPGGVDTGAIKLSRLVGCAPAFSRMCPNSCANARTLPEFATTAIFLIGTAAPVAQNGGTLYDGAPLLIVATKNARMRLLNAKSAEAPLKRAVSSAVAEPQLGD